MMVSKLTDGLMFEIYQDFLYGDNRRTIADRYGVEYSTVQKIVSGHTGAYITGLKVRPSVEELANGKPFASIPGHVDQYITTDGVVISNAHGKTCIIATHFDAFGYKRVTLGQREKRTGFLIHHLLCIAFKADSYFEGAEVRHLDGNKVNNDLDNLKWGTRKENMEDRTLHGRGIRGTRNPNAKLRESDVQQARDMISNGLQRRAIADNFNVTAATISAIALGRSWGWLPYSPADSPSSPVAKPKPSKVISNTPSRPIQSSHVTIVVTRNRPVGSMNRW